MTPSELHELSRLCAEQPSSVDAFMDDIIAKAAQLDPDSVLQTDGRDVLAVARKQPDVGRLPRGSSSYLNVGRLSADEEAKQLGDLLTCAGVGPALRKLRKQHERNPPAKTADAVPQERWVVESERTPPPAAPDEQALACLRLLASSRVSRIRPWVQDLVRTRLNALVVEYPALLHPRLSWAWMNEAEASPLAHALAIVVGAGLPEEVGTISARALRDFARHPAVRLGLEARAPNTNSRVQRPMWQGKTLLEMLSTFESPRLRFATSLLRIERLRTQGRDPIPVFRDEAALHGLKKLLVSTFTSTWVAFDGQPMNALRSAFLEEFRTAPFLSASRLGGFCSHGANRIFFDPSMSAANPVAHRMAVAPNSADRLARLLSYLVSTNAAECAQEAARMVARALFPLQTESPLLEFGALAAEPATFTDIPLTCQLIDALENAGHDRDLLHDRVHARAASPDNWLTATTMMSAQRRMDSIISGERAEGSARTVPLPTATRRRRKV